MYQKSKRLCQATSSSCENPHYICKVFGGKIKDNTGRIQGRRKDLTQCLSSKKNIISKEEKKKTQRKKITKQSTTQPNHNKHTSMGKQSEEESLCHRKTFILNSDN